MSLFRKKTDSPQSEEEKIQRDVDTFYTTYPNGYPKQTDFSSRDEEGLTKRQAMFVAYLATYDPASQKEIIKRISNKKFVGVRTKVHNCVTGHKKDIKEAYKELTGEWFPRLDEKLKVIKGFLDDPSLEYISRETRKLEK